jgi:hypothetical protein
MLWVLMDNSCKVVVDFVTARSWIRLIAVIRVYWILVTTGAQTSGIGSSPRWARRWSQRCACGREANWTLVLAGRPGTRQGISNIVTLTCCWLRGPETARKLTSAGYEAVEVPPGASEADVDDLPPAPEPMATSGRDFARLCQALKVEKRYGEDDDTDE